VSWNQEDLALVAEVHRKGNGHRGKHDRIIERY
jgi:hypothetical protein